MKYLAFFDDVESIVVYDDLCKFLGVNDDGIIEITYADIVKFTGHSCGTVSGAYLIALKGLKALYSDELPRRGDINVEVRNSPRDENAGVVGAVLSNITGATIDCGFGGIPTGEYNRRDLFTYDADIDTDVCFTRLDTGKKVGINYIPQRIVNPMDILMSAIKPDAKEEDIKSFPTRFQAMVKLIFDNSDKVIEIKKLGSGLHIKKLGSGLHIEHSG